MKEHLSHNLDFPGSWKTWRRPGRKASSDSRPPGPSAHFDILVARGGPRRKGARETPSSRRSRESWPGKQVYRGVWYMLRPFCPSTTLVLWNLVFLSGVGLIFNLRAHECSSSVTNRGGPWYQPGLLGGENNAPLELRERLGHEGDVADAWSPSFCDMGTGQNGSYASHDQGLRRNHNSFTYEPVFPVLYWSRILSPPHFGHILTPLPL